MDAAFESGHGDDETERDDGSLADLVLGAQRDDAAAWRELIERFTPLVVAITRGYRLSVEDAQDVRQMVWFKLFENIAKLREPQALPGWIRTTTKREALRQLKAGGRTQAMDPSMLASLVRAASEPAVDTELLRVERERAVNDGLNEIEPQHRTLLILLHADERPSYQAIGKTLGMPTGSIGPTRARGLQKLRRTTSMTAFLGVDSGLLAAG